MRARGHAWNRVIFVNNQPLSAFTEKTGLRQCGWERQLREEDSRPKAAIRL